MKDNSVRQILRAVRPLRNRMHMERSLLVIMSALSIAGTVSVCISYFALVYPVTFLILKIARIYIGAILLAGVAVLFVRPDNKKVLKMADKLGLKERLITAYELRNENTPIVLTQREDAILWAEKFDYKEKFKIRFPKSIAFTAGLLAALVAVSFLIPSWAKGQAVEAENIINEINKQAKRIEEMKDEFAVNSELNPEKTMEIIKKLEQLLKELEQTKTSEEALKAISRTQNELKKLEYERHETDLAQLIKELEANPLAYELGESLANSDAEDMKQQLEQLINKIMEAERQQQQELLETLERAAQNMQNSPDISKSLEALATAINSGDPKSIGQKLLELSGELPSLEGGQQLSDDMLEQMLEAMQNAKYQIAELSQESPLLQPGLMPGGQQVSTGGNMPGEQAASGGGNIPGGEGSSGVGSNIGEKDLGYSGEEQDGGGRQPGEYQEEEYVSIFVPERLGGDSDPTQVSDAKGDLGQSYWIDSNRAPVEKGQVLPYTRVFKQYKDEAMAVLDGESIPPVMEQIVRDYFMSLE